MPIPVLGLFPWLIGLFASTLGTLFTWFASFLALRLAVRFTLVIAYILAIAALTLAVAVLVKGLIMNVQTAMPGSLGAATYFLPNNINLIMGAYFSMRVSYALYVWASDRLTAIVRVSTS